jgi:trans-2,3-dihydro-3-hydroxyanthranilate isomerase
MSRRFRFRTVDVFTDRPLAGNPLAVFPDADGLTEDEMQALAREMNLSETAFVLPPTDAGAAEGADYRLRIFTPGTELPFAGHPSIGTAWTLADEGRFVLAPPRTAIRYELPIGVLGASLEVLPGTEPTAGGSGTERPRLGDVTMTQGRPELIHRLDEDEIGELCEAMEVSTASIGWPGPTGRGRVSAVPAIISTGLPHLIVPFVERAVMADIDHERLHDVTQLVSSWGCDSTALVGPGGTGAIPDADASVRIFDAGRLHIETVDPATGAAAGPISLFLGRLLGTRDATYRLVIEQGSEVGRPSRLVAETDFGPDGRAGDVRVAGRVVPVIEGWVTLP